MAVLPARHIFEIWCISLCGLAWAYKPLESISFKNTFFRNLLRTLEIYYIPSAGKKEKLQVQKQPIFLAAENDAVYQSQGNSKNYTLTATGQKPHKGTAERVAWPASVLINQDNSLPALNLDPATIHWYSQEKKKKKGLLVEFSFTGGM